MAKRKRRPSGFKSKAQWRMFFARKDLRRYAHGKAHRTPGGKKIRYRRLPYHVKGRTRRRVR